MRKKTIKIGGKTVTIQEQKIKDLKENLLPNIMQAWRAIQERDMAEIVDAIGEQLPTICPELQGIDLDDCYPSEIEAFVEAWVDVNFSGLKRVAGPVMSFVKMVLQRPGSDSGSLLDSLTTGKDSQSQS